MNDSKYGRLYPERAVLSLRNRAENERDALLRGGNLAGASLWTDVLDLLESEGFPEDEPLFLLRGQDVLAPWALRHYAGDIATSEAFGGKLSPSQVDAIHHLEEFADRMAAWEPRKLPD